MSTHFVWTFKDVVATVCISAFALLFFALWLGEIYDRRIRKRKKTKRP